MPLPALDKVSSSGSLERSRLSPPLPWRNAHWAALAAALALVLAAASAMDLRLAAGLAILLGIGAAVSARPSNLLWILAASIFLETLTVGGFTISRIIAPVALLVVVVELLRGRAALSGAAPLAWVAAYALWALASGIWTVSTDGTIFLLSSLAIALVYMLAFAVLLRTQEELEQTLLVLAFASLLIGLLAVAVYFDELGGFGETLQGGRAQGGVGDPDFFAAYQLVTLPLVLVMVGRVSQPWLQLTLAGTAIVILGSVITSLSRGAFIALLFLILLLFAWPARTLFGSRRNKAVVLIVMALGSGVVASRALPELVARITSIVSPADQEEARGSGRLDVWLAARRSIDERPLLGLGYGGFQRSSNELILRTPGIDPRVYKPREAERGLETHNAYLGTTADLGLVGLVLYLGLLISTVLFLRRTAKEAQEAGQPFIGRVANALVLGLVAWMITSFFLSTETSRAFFIVLGIGLALPRLARAREGEDSDEPPKKLDEIIPPRLRIGSLERLAMGRQPRYAGAANLRARAAASTSPATTPPALPGAPTRVGPPTQSTPAPVPARRPARGRNLLPAVVLVGAIVGASAGYVGGTSEHEGSRSGSGSPSPSPAVLPSTQLTEVRTTELAIDVLGTERAQGRRRLAAARTGAGQARAARRLARAHESAARTIAGAPGRRSRRALRVIAALDSTASHYLRLAAASADGDRRTFDAARRLLARDEVELAAAMLGLTGGGVPSR